VLIIIFGKNKMTDIYTINKDGSKEMSFKVRIIDGKPCFEDEYNAVRRFLKWLGYK
jgi:hypothetical protein